MKEKPTGFIARCRCGAVTGAIDADHTERKDMGKLLGEWLMHGCTVEPRFGGTWQTKIEACRCNSKPDDDLDQWCPSA